MASKASAAKKSDRTPSTEHAVAALLRKRFDPGEWAVFTGLRNGTGYSGRVRTADAVALNTWPSRGMEMYGIEIKVTRSDWLRELSKPEKSAAIQKYCDRWWVVTASAEHIQTGELPPTWGHMACDGGKIKVLVEAPKLEAAPFDRAFVCSLLRQAAANIPRSEVEAIVEEKFASERAEIKADREKNHEARYALPRLKELQSNVDEFEKLAGIRIDGWGTARVAEQFKLFMALREYDPDKFAKEALFHLDHLVSRATELSQEIQSAMKSLPTPTQPESNRDDK